MVGISDREGRTEPYKPNQKKETAGGEGGIRGQEQKMEGVFSTHLNELER